MESGFSGHVEIRAGHIFMGLPEILFGRSLGRSRCRGLLGRVEINVFTEGELALPAKAELPQNAFSMENGAQRAAMLRWRGSFLAAVGVGGAGCADS